MALDTTFLNNVTREKFIKTLKNNLYQKPVLMNRLFAKNRVQDMSGRSLSWDVVMTEHASVGLFSGYDTLANQPVNPVQQASLSVGNYYATVAISGEEERKNSGSVERLLDMTKVQFDNAQATLTKRMSTDLYSDGTAVNGRQPIIGLGSAVLSTGTYANISRTTYSSWAAQANTSAHTIANLKDPTSTSYFPSILRTSFTNASWDGRPDLIVTTAAIYNLYQDIAQTTSLRFNNEVANLGFGGVEFGPGVTMVFDKYCTANYVYGLNLDSFSVFVYPGANFDMKEPGWQVPVDQDAKVAHLLWSGQLRCEAPRENFVMSNVAAS